MISPNSKDLSLRDLLKQLSSVLTQKRKFQLISLLILFIISSFSETLSLAVIAPYLYFLVNPQQFINYPFVRATFSFLNIESNNASILFFLTFIVIASSIISGLIRFLNLWFSNKLSFGIGSDIGCLAFKNIINKDYSYHFSTNSNHLIATISNDINIVVVNVISPIIQLFAALILVSAISFSLLILSPLPTILTIVAVIISYIFFLINSKPKLKHNSEIQSFNNRKQIKSLQDGLGYIRNIILSNNQEFFIEKYRKYDVALRNAQAQSGLLTSYTKIILEPTVISLIVISGYLMAVSGKESEIIPALGIFALGAQKILPFTQKVYEGWASSSGSTKSLSDVLELVNIQNLSFKNSQSKDFISFKFHKLELKDISFNYKKNIKVLEDITLEINAGECIGIIGKTGSGKSTLIDILNTLLHPSNGEFFVNNENLHLSQNKNKKLAFRKIISHIPQNIYLSDDSIASNIALGIPKSDIDYKRMEFAINTSEAKNFIDKLPNRLDTHIGERGIQLSGGEKQRIGIARALYFKSQILILDEATNSLDVSTESKVIKKILSLPQSPTLIMIAHRLNTLKNCDFIYEIKNGRIVRKFSGKDFISN